MKRKNVLIKIASIFFIVGLAIAAYILVIRPWQMNWGATPEEISRPMPGDGLLKETDFNATRGVTIDARAEEIWPWIVQIGHHRAGFYSYDWFDNQAVRSAEEIVPELQNLAVGDDVPISSIVIYKVWSLEPDQSIVWVGAGDEIDGTWTWALYPINVEQTRLVTRLRGDYDWSKPTILFHLLVDGGDFAFMRKSMLGIQQRAQGQITDTFLEDTAEGILWFGTLFLFIGAIFQIVKRDNWLRPWLLALFSAATFQVIFYARPPIWLGVILEFAILAGLIWWRGPPIFQDLVATRQGVSDEPK